MTLVRLPHTAETPVHPVRLQVTSLLDGSLSTVAANSRVPFTATLPEGGERETRIAVIATVTVNALVLSVTEVAVMLS